MVGLPISSSVRRPKLGRSLGEASKGCIDADKAAALRAAEASERNLLLSMAASLEARQ